MSNGNQKADSIILKVLYATIIIFLVIAMGVDWKYTKETKEKYDKQIFELQCDVLMLKNKLGGRSVYISPDYPKLKDCIEMR